MLTWQQLVSVSNAVVVGQPPTGEASSYRYQICTDTRQITTGHIYLALSGERFDGHDFLDKAFEQGAVAAFVSQEQYDTHPAWQKTAPCLLVVPDTLTAYLQLARFYREQHDVTVIGVTGSSGKTTVKDMLYSVFSSVVPTQCSFKNHNNEIGLCQTLFSLKPETKVLIVEMGMRGLNQISILSEYAKPNIGLVINIGTAHIGLLGSREAIAQAKCELFEYMDPKIGLAIFDGEEPLLQARVPQIWQGKTAPFDLKEAEKIHTTPEGMTFTYHGESVQLKVFGDHQIKNALAIFKAAEAYGLTLTQIATGLNQYESTEGRWAWLPLPNQPDAWVVNDAYNANPDSMKASLTALFQTPYAKTHAITLVLGGMKELGNFAESKHTEVGQWLAEQQFENLQALFTVGEEGAWLAEGYQKAGGMVSVQHQETIEPLMKVLEQQLRPQSVVFLKGSRAYQLDQLGDYLVKTPNSTVA